MALGLSILGLISILIFFGVGERFLRKVGIPNWLAFIIVAALSVGIIFPGFSIGIVSVNVGGFIVPIIAMLIFFFVLRGAKSVALAFFSILSVASVTTIVGLLIDPTSVGLSIAMSVIIGFTGGAVAYLVGMDRLCALIGVMGGIVAGNAVSQLILRYFVDGRMVVLGSVEIFNAIIIATLVAVVLVEAIGGLKRMKSSKDALKYTASESSSEIAPPIIEVMPIDDAKIKSSNKSEFKDYFSDDE